MWLIVGLGNPGIRYRYNRHNIGYCVADLLAEINNINLKKDRILQGLVGKGLIGKEEVLVLKPAAYMNRSGTSVKGLSELHGISPHKILVVLDDIDLPWGKLRIRKSGSSAGHRGMESIINELGTTNFPRLRMGIGRSIDSNVVEHVLGNFSKDEKRGLGNYCKKAIDAISTIIVNIDTAMNKFN